ncbi:MAG: DUF4974 domain-containing protein [Phaeodactylibacter sp.]|uniref:DUF4974 domain-containing protein n=1 Tax=Phaeodactylibacter sp. TaxID=1940289 RepID=UPI0032ED4DF0
MKKLLLLTGLFCFGCTLSAQSNALLASYRMVNQTLEEVLGDLEQRYKVHFSYSPDFIPLEQKVSVNSEAATLETIMDEICRQLPISYRKIGDQVMLKPSRQKDQLGQLAPAKPKVRQQSPIYPADIDEEERERLSQRMQPIRRSETKVINGPGGDAYRELNFDLYRLPPPPPSAVTATDDEDVFQGDRRLAQISILPYVGTNLNRSAEITNNVSLNVLWGTNGGVDGLEVGGFYNEVINDVEGVQVAGVGSKVGGDVTGTQVGGIFNINKGKVQGVQAAGIFNIAGETQAIQAAGLFNITQGDAAGLQASGLFNIAKGKADGMQVASLFNKSEGFTRSQISGLFNKAGDVEGGQVSSLLNVAGRVDGFQIALINVADTVNGVPVGLLNIVKNGYNRFELSSNDALFANAALKLGAYSFYNIFKVGMRWDSQETTGFATAGSTPVTEDERVYTWGLGYGIGTTKRFSPNLMMNVEATCMHINEIESWTKEMNLLNQLSLTLGYNGADRKTSFFAGPVANLMVSRVMDPETGELGSRVIDPSYTLADGGRRTNLRFWIGVQGGIRF